MRYLSRWFVRQVSRKAKPYLFSYGILQTVKIKPALVWEPGAERVLVLSPHFDDEVIGCGGTIIKHIRKGAKVTVVFFTDGRFGSSALLNLEGEERQRYQEALMAIRRMEAASSLKKLGVAEGIYFDAPETMVGSDSTLQSRLRNVLDDVKPDVVYLPFFLEEHPDHRAVGQVLLDCTRGRSDHFDCFGYEVWTPLFPNCLVEISDVVERKKEAILQYASQLSDKDYVHSALGLNAYRSTILQGQRGYVEAFYMATLSEYRRLYEAFRLAPLRPY